MIDGINGETAQTKTSTAWKEQDTLNQQDHDNIIELKLLVKVMSEDIKDLKDGIIGRLTNLEAKVSTLEEANIKFGLKENADKTSKLWLWYQSSKLSFKFVALIIGIVSGIVTLIITLSSFFITHQVTIR